jgi:cytochrome c oxidase assembly protein subunit 15
MISSGSSQSSSVILRCFSKLTCFSVFVLIFIGGLVKSTESGLSVPDWPTTYGHFMFTFPLSDMVGGIKYEHTHRMVASVVGFITLVQCVWLYRAQVPRWIKHLGLCSFIAVVFQGVLGGLTVKYFLPVWLSSFHGTLAHIYFLLTLMIAYGLSVEYSARRTQPVVELDSKFLRMGLIFIVMVLLQLVCGNLMRHTESGLAVPDFPTMGGAIIPTFNQAMLEHINVWRFEHGFSSVTIGQVFLHSLHRVWAFLILIKLIYLNFLAYQRHRKNGLIMKTLFGLNLAVGLQIALGIATVLSMKEVYITTFHVVTGALVLGISLMLILRSAPVAFGEFQTLMAKR